MCGIFGIVDPALSREMLQTIVNAALEGMITRGPDGMGFWQDDGHAHGMRRLAIQDLQHGQQPFFAADGRIVVFQNGEIYNFRRLREELQGYDCSFISECDTEVLAHGYAKWGMEGLLHRLDGMYAIAVYDSRVRRLYLARDIYGEKPLFWSASGPRFAYGSTLSALAALSWTNASISQWGLHRYLCLGFIPGEQTICNGIHRLAPGCWLEFDLETGRTEIHRYHDFVLSPLPETDWTLEQLENDINYAVKSRLVADVPVGIFLSGGIDSSLLAYFAARTQRSINTFSIGFQNAAYDESAHAMAVARHVGSSHHHFIFDERQFLDTLPAAARFLEEPVGDQACLPLFLLSAETRKYVTVALSGEGADELFGGYFYYTTQPRGGETLCSLLEHGEGKMPSGFPLMLSANAANTWMEEPPNEELEFERQLSARLEAETDPLRRAKLCDIRTWLADDLLVKLDRMGMSASIEGRAPYLAANMTHWLDIPPHDSIRENAPKFPMRCLAEKYLPREVWDRPKQGFILPMRQWLKTWFETRDEGRVLESGLLPGLKGKNIANWVKERLVDPTPGWERLMFSLLLLHIWAQEFHMQVTKLQKCMRMD